MAESKRPGMEGKRHSAVSSSAFGALTPLGLCLCVLALRVTYTEAPTVQTFTLAGGLIDTIYSLTLSGLLIFAFVAWIVAQFIRNRTIYRFTGMEIGLGLVIIAAVLASVGASDKRAAINHATILIAPIFGAMLLSQVLDSPAKVRLVLVAIVALGIVSAYQCAEQFLVSNAITIEQYEKDPNMLLTPLGIEPGTFPHFLFEHRLYSRGIRGFFTTSNSAASFAICASFAGIALLAGRLGCIRNCEARLRRVGPTLTAVVLLVAGLLLTQSKGGIAAFLAGLAVFGLLMAIERRFPVNRGRVRVLLFAAVLLCVVTGGLAAVHYGRAHGRLPGGNSMLVRWQYWTASARMYADHPVVGIGPGNFSDHYPHYKAASALESVADPHNWPLSLILQYGPLGLLGFLAMLGRVLWRSILPTQQTAEGDRTGAWSASKRVILAMLLVLGLCLLLVRPLLIPTSGENDFDVRVYEAITLFVTPVAAFLIGFLLAAAPVETQPLPSRLAQSALSASLVAAVLAVLLHNLIDFAIFEPAVWMAFWMLLACLAAFRRHGEPPVQTVAPRSSRRRQLSAVTAAALLVAYACWIWMPVCRMTTGIAKSQRMMFLGRADLAHAALEEATQADRLSPAAPNFNGRLYLQRSAQASGQQAGLLEQAARCFREALERSPADYKNYEKLAVVYRQAGKHKEAYDWYLKAARRYPGNERLWFESGQLAERTGQPQVALGHYRKAVETEDRYRAQFRMMYPERKSVVSRLGEKEYRLAQERIGALQQ
ncbi:MAG TPA: O-antigen ligase family protein [Sedimentisphaerales bacterium]|nr:O-antigen ligase family protein [Sedimentisphaerales bacterium]